VFSIAHSVFLGWVVQKGLAQIPKRSGDTSRNRIVFLHSCASEASEMAQEVRIEIGKLLKKVLPPKTLDEAEALSSAGASVIKPLGAFATKQHQKNWRACAYALIGTLNDAAFPVLAKYAKLHDAEVDKELLAGKRYFESSAYNKIVLSHCTKIGTLSVSDVYDLELMCSLPALIDVKIVEFRENFGAVPSRPTVLSLALDRVTSCKDLGFLSSFPELTRLLIVECPNLEDFSGLKLCPRLRDVTVDSDNLANADAFLGLKEIESLDLAGCTSMIDVRAINKLERIARVTLPFAVLYDDLHPRLRRQLEILEADVDDYV
jgi:hypothetical protein